MRGLIHTAQVYRRVTSGGRTGYEDSPFDTWKCRIDPLGANIQLREDLAQSTHWAVGVPTPALEKGWKIVVGGITYRIVHVQVFDAPGATPHHQEVYLTRAE
jgi:glyoxylase-like metal-dependent hydrolase (beta-lactamase superfamily II)